MPLREFLYVLRSRWITIVATILVVVAIGSALTLRQKPVYEASSQVFLAAEAVNPGKAGQGTYIVTAADLTTYVAVLGSPSVMDPLREELGLRPGTPIDVNASVQSADTSILNVTARASDADLAARIANATGPQLASVAGDFSVLLKASGQRIRATTISPATVPGSPVSPDVERNVLMALLAGLFLGVGLAFVRHALDTKVRAEIDIRTWSNSPMLSGLPVQKTGHLGLILEKEPFGGYAEAIRRLRTNLRFVDVTTGSHSFVITSSVPGEGKTTTAINLAFAMAHAGGRVLLVDADLRNPSVTRRMGLESSAGLTSVLLGEAGVDDVVQQWKDTQLHVLGAGKVPPNPSELLGSEPMRLLFEQLTKEYDYVLIDSPPLVPVIDAVLLEKLAGGMLMVVAWNRTKKRDLASALKSLDTVGAHVSGFTFNMVSVGDSDVYRHGYYRYKGYAPETETKTAAMGGTPSEHAGKLRSSSTR